MSYARAVWDKVMESHSSMALPLGPTNVDRYLFDPKRMAFFFSRYKFATKMMRDCSSILDVGCGDGMGLVTFLADTAAKRVVGVDFEPKVIAYATETLAPVIKSAYPEKLVEFILDDFVSGASHSGFDGVVSLDVIEHLEPSTSSSFIAKLAASMGENGVAIVGTPNAYAAQYGSVHSQIGHINNLTADDLRGQMKQHFRQCFMFSQNDEVVHTGFDKMAHYLLAVGVK